MPWQPTQKDGLSRRPCDQCRHCNRQEIKDQSEERGYPGHSIRSMNLDANQAGGLWCDSWSVAQIMEWQAADTIISKVLSWVEAGKPPRKEIQGESAAIRIYWSLFEQLELKDGILYRKADAANRIATPRLVAPQAVREHVFKFLHSSRTSGHQGVKRTGASARQRFWWPRMKKDVAQWCQFCALCQQHNLRPGAKHSMLQQVPTGAPMERVAFDILTFPEETSDGNTCILVICDYFTKWVEAFVDHKAATVVVTKVFLRFGVPRYLHSDQAPEFMGELMTELCKLLEIQRTRTCPCRPQSDGLVDQFNRTLITMLSKFYEEHHDDWDQHLPYLLCAYRATVNESTRYSPNLLMLGCKTNLPVDLMFPLTEYHSYRCHNEYVEQVRCALEDNYERARQQLGAAAARQKCNYNVRTKSRQYKEGDFVLRFYTPNLRSKLNPPYIGPYCVMACLGDVTYKIQKSLDSRPIVVHADHLKRFHADGPPFTWGEGIGNENEQSNDRSGMNIGNLMEDDVENLLESAEQCDDTTEISR